MTGSIKLIVIDLDATLLNSQHELSVRNAEVIQAAREQGIKIVLATGKTRNSALSLIAKLDIDTPGIYVQGLVVHDGNGSIKHQTVLDPAVVRKVITFAEDRGFSLVAYSGTTTYVRKRSRDTDLLMDYGEGEPQVVGPLQNLLHNTPINKVIAIHRADARRVTSLRWQLNTQLDGTARLLQAGVPEMLEIVPRGGSKGAALKALLKEMNVDPMHVMAIGDGENDIEMIQLVGTGVAVGNADKAVKDAADHVVASNDENGVAEAIERFALKPTTSEAEEDESVSETET